MTYVNRKFKCKDHDTLYEILALDDDGYYLIQWRKSDGSFDTAENTISSVENAFQCGGWYFVDGLGDEAKEAVQGSDAVNKPKQTALEKQVSGDHYKNCKIQPVEYIYANNIPFLEANVIKYTSRHKAKNKAADIKKAIHCLELILQMEYGE